MDWDLAVESAFLLKRFVELPQAGIRRSCRVQTSVPARAIHGSFELDRLSLGNRPILARRCRQAVVAAWPPQPGRTPVASALHCRRGRAPGREAVLVPAGARRILGPPRLVRGTSPPDR